MLEYLYNFSIGKKNTLNWSNAEFTFTVMDDTKNRLEGFNDKPNSFDFLGEFKIKLFDVWFIISKAHRCFENCMIKNYEKTMRLLDAYEPGDKMKLEMVPRTIGTGYDELVEK